MPLTHVALTFDDGFWAPAFATIRSAGLSTPRPGDMVFHLCHTGLEPEHKADLDSLVPELGIGLVYHDIRDYPEIAALSNQAPRRVHWGAILYARLFLDRMMPPEVDRFIYIDCDMMIRRPLEWLAGLDLEGHPIAAVQDPGRLRRANGRDMREADRPFFRATRYFNAGIFVADRAGFAAADLPGLLLGHMQAGTMEKLFFDQDLLNLAFRDNWLALDWRWNLTKPSPALRALDPYVVHYTTGHKPWRTLSYLAFGSTYKDVMTRELFRRYRRYRWRKRLARLFRR